MSDAAPGTEGSGTTGDAEGADDETQYVTVFDYVGGRPFFDALVDAFYDGVAADPVLAPMYPDDLDGPKWRLSRFLEQYWGGTTEYSDQRGHPRLRARHLPFSIATAERDAWFRHMSAAIHRLDPPEPAKSMMLRYCEQAATAMVNAEE